MFALSQFAYIGSISYWILKRSIQFLVAIDAVKTDPWPMFAIQCSSQGGKS
jgi:hypothetical protein